MIIRLNGFTITKLPDGRYKATDGFATFCTYDLELAIEFAEAVGEK